VELIDQEIKHTHFYITTISVPEVGEVKVKDVYEGSKLLLSQYVSGGFIVTDPYLIERIDAFMEYKELRILF
jgi:hypothetical protein